MIRKMLHTKLHHARVTEANKEYAGSITIGKEILNKTSLFPFECVLVADVENGERFETYVIEGEEKEICVNGAAANQVEVGDRLIIMAFAYINFGQKPEIFVLNDKNEIQF